MRHLLRAALATVMLLGPAASLAHAVTIADLINLRANGVSDDILIALIQSDGTVFKLTADDVLSLKKRGLSDRVLIAMLLSGKQTQTQEPTAAEDVNALLEPPRLEPAARPEPPVVNVTQHVTQTVEQTHVEREYIPYPVAVPIYTRPVKEEKPPAPVYWGYNGKQRPDSWREPKNERKPDPTPDSKPDANPDVKPGSKPIKK